MSKRYEAQVRKARRNLARSGFDITKVDVHRLTWRGWHAVNVLAGSREEAISKALSEKPAHIPAGTQLYYGSVEGTPVGVSE